MLGRTRAMRTGILWAVAMLVVACGGSGRTADAPAPSGAPAAAPAATSLSVPAAAAPAAAPPATVEKVRMGALGASTDAGLFIALEQGFFKEQGVDVEMTPFDSAARMVAPLGAGQLDVGAGSHSAALFNAAARDVSIKLVADKGNLSPGFGFQGLMFRKDLWESGRLRTPADLRGMRVALPSHGITTEVSLAKWLEKSGLTLDDVEVVELNFADHASALGGRSLEAVVSIEPFLTRILDQDLAALYQRADEIIPGYQVGEVMYGGQFARERPEAALRFMKGYLRAVRFYNDVFVKGDLAKRQDVITTLAKHTPVKDAALYDRMVMPGLNPDGKMNRATIASDQEFWLSIGLQNARVNLDEVVDQSFADSAAAQLGPYR